MKTKDMKKMSTSVDSSYISKSQTSKPKTKAKNQTQSYLKIVEIIIRKLGVSPQAANLILKSIISITGSVVSIVTVVLSLLKGLGVI